MECRICKTKLRRQILDLGVSPPANAFITREDLNKPEVWYPLRLLVCDKCFLVQTEDFVGRENLFTPDYAYFSSYSDTWLMHAKKYVEMVIRQFNLSKGSLVVEIGSNDGYLLQYFKECGIPCYGVEPTHLVAETARSKGIDTVEEFFGLELAKRLVRKKGQADLIVANNVLAHVPDLRDFVSGVKVLLKSQGVATFEFQYVVPLVKDGLFDTIYHEHFSYFSFSSVKYLFEEVGLSCFDVEFLSTHGGSLRVYVKHNENGELEVSERVNQLLEREREEGVLSLDFYEGLQSKVERIKLDFLDFLIECKRQGKRVAGYGAAAKGNTLFNYCGIKRDFIEFVVDRNPFKQGKFLPGSRIPILPPEFLKTELPDYVLIIPWNIAEEIVTQLNDLRNCGVKFFKAIPGISIY